MKQSAKPGPSAGETAPAIGDLPVGSHAIAVLAPGYKELNETITISPSATLERRYTLERRRGAAWYGTKGLTRSRVTIFQPSSPTLETAGV